MIEDFKVGDIIIGLPTAELEYYVTTMDCYCRVIKVLNYNGDIKVISLYSTNIEAKIGYEHWVKPEYFRKATKEEIEKLFFLLL